MAKKRYKIDLSGGRAFVLPYRLLVRPEFRSLSPKAVKVLLVLGTAYHGRNNGNLACTETTMDDNGGMDRKTISSALKELVEAGLILKTREPRKGSDTARCALYALAWAVIDECPSSDLDVSPGPARLSLS
jgi:DNA-binding transcriptional ArsR family regulator